jgi:hypothetical protein
MGRVLILGRGGAGKSTLARRLSVESGLPLVELDKEFRGERLEPLPTTSSHGCVALTRSWCSICRCGTA